MTTKMDKMITLELTSEEVSRVLTAMNHFVSTHANRAMTKSSEHEREMHEALALAYDSTRSYIEHVYEVQA